MKNLSIFFILILFVGCSSINKSRKPSSIDNIKLSEINIDLLEQVYRFALENQQKYRVLTYPIREPSDVEKSTDFIERMKLNESVNEKKIKFKESILAVIGYGPGRQEFNSAVGDYVRPLILSRFSPSEKKRLVEFCFLPKGAGDYYDIATAFTYECENFNFLISDEDIVSALRFIPSHPKKVRYDGGKGWHIYDDPELEYNIRLLTLAVATEKEKFIKIFDEQKPEVIERYRKNSHGMNEEDKVEPFDLLTLYLTWFTIGKTQGSSDFGELNKIYIGKLVQKSMSRLFTMFDRDLELDSLPTMSVMKKDDRALFWCANGRFRPRMTSHTGRPNYSFHKAYGNDILEGMIPSFELNDLLKQGQVGFTFYCNTMEYKTTVEIEKDEPLNPPSPIDYSNQNEVNVLITVALVSEMSPSALVIGKLYLRTLGGWDLVEDFEEIDTKVEFSKLFPETDLYIPVTHAMDVNAFHVGTTKGYSLKLERRVTANDGTTKHIKATILFPKSDNGKSSSLTMNPGSLSELMLKRDEAKRQPLFLMNTSCGSEKTLFTWMATYRKVLEKKKKLGKISRALDDLGTPHIVGSKRFFETNSIKAILSHLSYPMGAILMLTKGDSVREVVDFLGRNKKTGFFANALSAFIRKDVNEEKNSSENFEPDYVMDHPKLLKIGGYKIRVNRRGFPAEREY